jgi:alpha-tubulin suppressor-like RCC1 family protein
VLDNGSAMCWGNNGRGKLGNGSSANDNVTTPGSVLNLSNVRSISAGLETSNSHTCAVLDNGSASCWGNNNWGQLGNGSPNNSYNPYPVAVNGLESVKSISAGGSHTCAVLDNGSAMCWGYNHKGQLGDGTTDNNSYPVAVRGLESVQYISAGISHTCAVLDNGSATCWGYNYSGQLGNGSSGTTVNNSYPVAVNGLESVKSISAGLNHTCALLDNGSATCWGNNSNGKLGNGFSSGTYSTPNAVSGLGAIKTLSAGRTHTCAVLDNGSATCWGNNSNGQLGDGTTTQSTSPVAVSGLGSVNSISAGGYINGSHTCAVLDNGSAKCWGYNNDGQLGNGNKDNATTPQSVLNLSNIRLP